MNFSVTALYIYIHALNLWKKPFASADVTEDWERTKHDMETKEKPSKQKQSNVALRGEWQNTIEDKKRKPQTFK